MDDPAARTTEPSLSSEATQLLAQRWQQSYPELGAEAALSKSFRPRSPGPRSGALALPPGHRRLETIGEGGMGLVFRARQRALRRDVALKTLKRLGPEALESFLSEALVTAYLDHPNIVPIYGLDQAGQELELSMKLIDGRTWTEALDEDRPWANPKPRQRGR